MSIDFLIWVIIFFIFTTFVSFSTLTGHLLQIIILIHPYIFLGMIYTLIIPTSFIFMGQIVCVFSLLTLSLGWFISSCVLWFFIVISWHLKLSLWKFLMPLGVPAPFRVLRLTYHIVVAIVFTFFPKVRKTKTREAETWLEDALREAVGMSLGSCFHVLFFQLYCRFDNFQIKSWRKYN